MIVLNLFTTKAAAERELLLNKQFRFSHFELTKVNEMKPRDI